MRKKKQLNIPLVMFFISSPIWIIIVIGGLLDTFDEGTWKSNHMDLELKLYDCKQLYTGYSSRGDGIPPLKGDQIHSESECKKLREDINTYNKKLYNEEYPYDWKMDRIENWDEFRMEGEVKTGSSRR
ncbi:hypothetical protein QUF93_13825 [Bacillus hominis]|uniref:hypothetical protein n=1 Tax=Bacillus hominis TaxID=2817478 RepID=UPI0025A002E1|nr:hypothetical protein [Bacillus hominis]MDM5193626.1 hypothetical protein [Bacillus hominis]